MSPLKVRLTRPQITVLVLVIVVVAVLVIVGGVAWWALSRADEPAATPAPTPTATETPAPEPVALSNAVPIAGTITAWTQATETEIARVLPAVGDAADGELSVYVSSQRDGDAVRALSTAVAADAGSEIDITFSARTQAELPVAVPAWIQLGAERVDLPELDAEWTEVTTTVALTEPLAELALMVDGLVEGLAIDDITVTEAGSDTNLVGNPSFEEVETSAQLLNRSLIMSADRAAAAVRMAPGAASWTITDRGGEPVVDGTIELGTGPAMIAFDDLAQGYYTMSITDAGGTNVTSRFAAIDYDGAAIEKDYRLGVGMHVENDYYNDAADALSSLGAGLGRNDILWRFNELTRGEYTFAPHYTENFDHMASHGVHLLGIVNYGNSLYGSGRTPEGAEALAAYGNYAAAIAERFDLVGLEVFNEFNHERFNTTACGTDPECYVPLLQSVHDAVRAVDPDLPIVAGSTARYPDDWFAGLWQAGGLELSDVVSYHPYEVMYEPHKMSQIIDQSIATMEANAGDTRPVWITEMGTSSKPGLMSQTGQASNLLSASLTALGGGAEKFFWYDLVNDEVDETIFEGNFGLYEQKVPQIAAYEPKPAAFAMALLVTQLGGREVTDAALDVPEGAIAYAFGDAGDTVYTVWSPSGSGTISIPSDEPLEFVTGDGTVSTLEPVGGAVEVPLSLTPSFVHVAGADTADAADETTDDEAAGTD